MGDGPSEVFKASSTADLDRRIGLPREGPFQGAYPPAAITDSTSFHMIGERFSRRSLASHIFYYDPVPVEEMLPAWLDGGSGGALRGDRYRRRHAVERGFVVTVG